MYQIKAFYGQANSLVVRLAMFGNIMTPRIVPRIQAQTFHFMVNNWLYLELLSFLDLYVLYSVSHCPFQIFRLFCFLMQKSPGIIRLVSQLSL